MNCTLIESRGLNRIAANHATFRWFLCPMTSPYSECVSKLLKGAFITVTIDDFMFELMVISKRC